MVAAFDLTVCSQPGEEVVRRTWPGSSSRYRSTLLPEQFIVSDAAIRGTGQSSPNLVLWNGRKDSRAGNGYLTDLRASREVSSEKRKASKKAISRPRPDHTFPFTAPGAFRLNRRTGRRVFVRVNSKGTPLNRGTSFSP
jgi:hypothetical protein